MYLALSIMINLLVWYFIKETAGFSADISIIFLMFCFVTGLWAQIMSRK
ncbi:MAG: hypothetical protein ACRC1P_09740 [Cellulosilyticaceae bacterium]